MKSLLSAFVILSFLGVAVFGVFAMTNHDGRAGCLAAAARRTDCAETGNAASFFLFHFDVFKSFSAAVFGGNFASVLLFLPAWILFAAQAAVLNEIYAAGARPVFSESPPVSFRKKIIHWLSLRENSPSFA